MRTSCSGGGGERPPNNVTAGLQTPRCDHVAPVCAWAHSVAECNAGTHKTWQHRASAAAVHTVLLVPATMVGALPLAWWVLVRWPDCLPAPFRPLAHHGAATASGDESQDGNWVHSRASAVGRLWAWGCDVACCACPSGTVSDGMQIDVSACRGTTGLWIHSICAAGQVASDAGARRALAPLPVGLQPTEAHSVRQHTPWYV